MLRRIATLLLMVAPLAQAADKPLVFADIEPILQRHCVACHSGWFPKGGLDVETREELLEGGKQGAAVIPGEPDKGWLINLVVPRAGRPSAMPPGPVQLSPQEVEKLRTWIAQGAR